MASFRLLFALLGSTWFRAHAQECEWSQEKAAERVDEHGELLQTSQGVVELLESNDGGVVSVMLNSGLLQPVPPPLAKTPPDGLAEQEDVNSVVQQEKAMEAEKEGQFDKLVAEANAAGVKTPALHKVVKLHKKAVKNLNSVIRQMAKTTRRRRRTKGVTGKAKAKAKGIKAMSALKRAIKMEATAVKTMHGLIGKTIKKSTKAAKPVQAAKAISSVKKATTKSAKKATSAKKETHKSAKKMITKVTKAAKAAKKVTHKAATKAAKAALKSISSKASKKAKVKKATTGTTIKSSSNSKTLKISPITIHVTKR